MKKLVAHLQSTHGEYESTIDQIDQIDQEKEPLGALTIKNRSDGIDVSDLM